MSKDSAASEVLHSGVHSFFSFSIGNIMPEDKKVIGLSWEPQLSSLNFGSKSGSNDKSQHVSESNLVYKPSSELVDGLFVPPNDPKKVNKLLKKQVKDTAGKGWYVHILTQVLCKVRCL